MTPTGWFQVAFETEVPDGGLAGVRVGCRRLMIAKSATALRCFDAVCPHRGADLSQGPPCDDEHFVICRFHGLRIRLGKGRGPLFVREHPCFATGGMIFVHLGAQAPLPLDRELEEIGKGHRFVPGFTMTVRAPHALVIENAFDALHFPSVHAAHLSPVEATLDAEGVFTGRAELSVPPSPWQDSPAAVTVPLIARAFGTALIVSRVEGPRPYVVITASTPLGDGLSCVRLSMAFPSGNEGRDSRELEQYMIRQARRGVDADKAIWENMTPGAPRLSLPGEEALEAFWEYSRRFVDGE